LLDFFDVVVLVVGDEVVDVVEVLEVVDVLWISVFAWVVAVWASAAASTPDFTV
jgi:hypothetical protein